MSDPYRQPAAAPNSDHLEALPRKWFRRCSFCPLSYGQHDDACLWATLVGNRVDDFERMLRVVEAHDAFRMRRP